jgi:hypothetical protein
MRSFALLVPNARKNRLTARKYGQEAVERPLTIPPEQRGAA